MNKRVCKEDQIRLITECRQSGLSDYQWCEQNGIHPGNFYNWVSKLRKEGYAFPKSESKSHALPNKQEVVKVDLFPCKEASLEIEQNVSPGIVAELLINGVTVRLFSGADKTLIHNILQCVGGMNHAW